MKTQGTQCQLTKFLRGFCKSMYITPTLVEAYKQWKTSFARLSEKIAILTYFLGWGWRGKRKFSHFVDLKSMISAHAKDFCEKNGLILFYFYF